MSAVEIYMCKKGQKVEEGLMVISHDINDKEDAREDAQKRCKVTPSIERIVYYDVSTGGFKMLLSYTNLNYKDAPKGPSRRGGGGGVSRPGRKKKAAPQGMWAKTKKALGL